MPRTLSASLTATLQRQEMADELLFFLTISHASLNPPIRVVRDSGTVDGVPLTYTWGEDADGNPLTWQGFPFEITWVSDNDRAPEARLTVPNIDSAIGQAVDRLTTMPDIRVDLVLASEFDLTVNPRVTAGVDDPEAEASASGLFLVDIEVTAQTVTGRLISWDYTQEVYPNLRATPTRTPGLWW